MYGLQHGALAHIEQKGIKGPTITSVKPFKWENQRFNLYKNEKRETRINYINKNTNLKMHWPIIVYFYKLLFGWRVVSLALTPHLEYNFVGHIWVKSIKKYEIKANSKRLPYLACLIKCRVVHVKNKDIIWHNIYRYQSDQVQINLDIQIYAPYNYSIHWIKLTFCLQLQRHLEWGRGQWLFSDNHLHLTIIPWWCWPNIEYIMLLISKKQAEHGVYHLDQKTMKSR